MNQALPRIAVGVLLMALAAQPASAGPLATLHAGAAGLEWQPAVTGAGLTLTVSGPGGFYLREEFAPGQSAAFSVFDGAGNLRPSGVYVWELRAVFRLDEDTRRELEPARHSGDESALQKSGKLPSGRVYDSGSFSIQGGRVVALDQAEPDSPRTGTGVAPKGASIAPKATFTEGVCAGFDCPGSPAFGDSTILMMENNTRIKFGDTSVSPFPNNDWEIEANSATSGGLSYLGFNDCGTADNDGGCATDLVFAVEAGARQSALYVEGDGDVGLGTSNPVLDLHIVSGNTPALRLEQDGSSGFTPQTWDIAGNETNFFVRDVTSGSTLPLRIEPGTASSTLYLDSEERVGINTAAPAEKLHVTGTDSPKVLIDDTTDNANDKPGFTLRSPAAASAGDWFFEVDNAGNFQIDFGPSAGPEILISDSTATNGTVTVNGNLVVNGICTGCDKVFQPDFELESIEEHAALMWERSYLPGVGPTPEGESPIDVYEKTTGILQELEKAHIYIERLNQNLQAKDGQIMELTERLSRLEAALEVHP